MQDVYRAREGVKDLYGDTITCPCAENVLVDMTYNLGEAGLAEFTTFNALIMEGNWDAAADDLETGTLWCGQVGTRCTRDVKLIKSCDNYAYKKAPHSHKKVEGVCQKDMDALKQEAKEGSLGFSNDGHSYSHVADFIDASGYGGIQKGGFNEAIPQGYWA